MTCVEPSHPDAAIDLITGPIGSRVRVVPTSSSDGVYAYEGVLETRIAVDDRLDSLVLRVRVPRGPRAAPREARLSIRWAAIESVLILTTPDQEASS